MIDFTIYTRLFLVKLKSVVDGPILHTKNVVDRPIQYGYIIEAAISYYPIRNGWKLWYGKMVCSIINPYRIADPMTYRILD